MSVDDVTPTVLFGKTFRSPTQFELNDTLKFRPVSDPLPANMATTNPWGFTRDGETDPFMLFKSRESSPERPQLRRPWVDFSEAATPSNGRHKRPRDFRPSSPSPPAAGLDTLVAGKCPDDDCDTYKPVLSGPLPSDIKPTYGSNGRHVPLSSTPTADDKEARLLAVESYINEMSHTRPMSATPFRLNNVKLEPFHGYGQSAQDFLRHFELMCETQGVPPNKKAGYFALLLKSAASNWYWQLPATTRQDYACLQKCFLQRFHNPSLEALKMQALLQKEMGPNDSIDLYINEMSNLSSEFSLSEKEKLSFFLKGLRTDIKQYVLRQAPSTLLQAETAARLFASTALLTSSTHRRPGISSLERQPEGPDGMAVILAALERLTTVVQDSAGRADTPRPNISAASDLPPNYDGNNYDGDTSQDILSQLRKLDQKMRGVDKLDSRMRHLERMLACNPNIREPRTSSGGVLCPRCNGNHHESNCFQVQQRNDMSQPSGPRQAGRRGNFPDDRRNQPRPGNSRGDTQYAWGYNSRPGNNFESRNDYRGRPRPAQPLN